MMGGLNFRAVYKSTILVALALAISLSSIKIAGALSGSSFKAGRIMDDAVFYNGAAMSASSIQSFLNSKVPVCDTWGTQPYAGTTRAAYSTSKGYPPPFICLKDYKQNTPGKAAEAGLCNSIPARSNASAAQIIYDVSTGCGVSPKVLIILLQKEQTLVTDDWPWPIQYKAATGFACPDTAGCDATYGGFFNQVFYAARQYKYYRRSPNLFNFIAGENNFIQYNPNAACGGSNVYIQNQATAGLYNYTPYQPNAAALNNLYGAGNSCSAYGNRNFWRMYIEWFGSTYTTKAYAWILESQEIYSDAAMTQKFTSTPTAAPGGKLYARIKVRNMGYKPWDNTVTIRVGTSHSNDRSSAFYDTSWISSSRPAQLIESTVVPGSIGTFEFAMKAPNQLSSYKEYFSLVAENVAWMNDIGLNYLINTVNPVSITTTSDSQLLTNQTLLPGEYILSDGNGYSALVFQKDGNVVLYNDYAAVWQSGTHGKNSAKLIMQGDGNLVLYDTQNSPLWHSHTNGNNNAALKLQTNGRAVIYTTGNIPIWSTNTLSILDNEKHVNNILWPGNIYPGQKLETADREFNLILQGDGNLVLYSPTKALWSSKTNGKRISYLTMQSDGNLVLFDINNKPVWHTGTGGKGSAHLVIQQDGNLVLYKSSGQSIWDTRTNN